MIPDHLPPMIRAAGQLLPLPDAISHIHYPESEEMLAAARRRLAFDELFLIQLGMQERRSRWKQQVEQGNAFSVDLSKIFIDAPTTTQGTTVVESQPIGTTLWSTVVTEEPFEATLPFKFTNAQRRVLHEIFQDLERTQPMCRLLQGDVGAGKTAVAAAALYMAAINGYQGAIMAPTELLAEQHARSIGAMLEPFGIRTVLLTGSLKQRERTMGRAALESGEAMVAIGTHALIQEDVAFAKLGLVLIDEQHRFGFEQRDPAPQTCLQRVSDRRRGARSRRRSGQRIVWELERVPDGGFSRRGADQPPARRPLPRPRSVQLRAQLCPPSAAGSGRGVAWHEQSRAP